MNTLKLQENPKKLVKMGMLIAISIALVYLIHFPIFPAVPFMEYDPADIPILLGTFAFGTVGGLVLTIITSIIQGVTVSANSGVYGIIMHIIATGALTVVAGRIYETHKTKKRAIIGMICGALVMAVLMVGANLIITPLFMGVPRAVVWQLMPFIIGFNLVKAGINSVLTFFIYKRISSFLHS